MTEFEAYFRLGFAHITDLNGYDHILFIIALCAIYHLRDWKKVLILVTAFTIGHSITLAISTLDVLTFRSDIIELLIPITILITAVSNFFHKEPVTIFDETPRQKQYLRYASALVFGFIHGLGFSTYLKSLLQASSKIIAPLFAFNIGIELGQMVIVLAILLLAFIMVTFLKVKKHDWNLIISGITAGIALTLILKNLEQILQ